MKDLQEVPVLQVVLLDGGPILPPAKIATSISVEVPETPLKGLFRDGLVREIALKHHIVLLVPCCEVHDSIVLQGLLDISGALGVVPEAADELIVPIVLVLLPLLDNAIVIGVAKSELMASIGLKAHVIIDYVVKRVHER